MDNFRRIWAVSILALVFLTPTLAQPGSPCQTPGSKECFGGDLYECVNGQFELKETCDECRDGVCENRPLEPATGYVPPETSETKGSDYILPAVLIVVVIVIVYLLARLRWGK